ncbi:TadE/TadG family type IV pilus assembly protein [Alkaliphilus serpentinus]|uniref:Pilus assembly protein n=1 Tax=Alkaliphilus serpentinus TaxID=1482731 RepID=A0A833HR21_9FIRM|nr:TadE/TadG family type IV pilus assembly protein [Alkaliphilus serpentinus]KAB3532804.1 hypothetical protein F8153_01685 [Alkaliphilus serpentinus]
MRSLRNEKGSLTVEAALVLPIFICVIMTLALLIKVAYVHSIVQHAITETAHEIASNSYIYHVSGLADIEESIGEGLDSNAEGAKEDINRLTEAYSNIINNAAIGSNNTFSGFNEVKDHIENGDILGAIEEIKEVIVNVEILIESTASQAEKFMEVIDSVIEDPQSKMISAGSIIGQQLFNQLKTALGNAVAKTLMRKHILDSDDQSLEERLKELNIKELDFSKSRYFVKENYTDGIIDLVVTYKLDIPFPIKIVDDFNILQRVTVRAWMAGKNSELLSEEFPQELQVQKEIVDEIINIDMDIWDLPNFDRAEIINNLLGDPNLFNIKLIDKMDSNQVVSITSCRTTDNSYIASALYDRIKKDIEDMANFIEATVNIDGEKVEIKPKTKDEDENSDGVFYYDSKKLNFVIPDSQLSEEQLQSVYNAKEYAKEKNIELIITVIKRKKGN